VAFPYVFLDATYCKARVAGRVCCQAVVIATGVSADGRREVLGFDVGDSEDGAFWTAFLRSLKARGLHRVSLVISDAHEGLKGGYNWVMVPNVVGMSQWADGGLMATKPNVAGGAYLDRMSDHCGRCPYDPRRRTGPTACPFTAGYWAFLDRHREDLRGNHRMSRALAGLARRPDLPTTVEQERRRGTAAP
jgi:hypothetical protein